MDGLDLKSDEPKLDLSSQSETPVLLQGVVEKHDKKLKGEASAALDPDANNRDLLIEWDIWRNIVANQVNRNLTKHMNGWGGYEINKATRHVESKFPTGIQAGVDFVISSDQKVLKAEIIQPSGYIEYDQLILKSVYELEKNRQAKLLRFPEHSRRKSVEEMLGIQKVQGSQPQPFLKFGDTEKVQLSD